ncbi:MAG: DUF2330 domain-containing protein [Archangium sp.]|nr:DUF2330 domain-containing protein [Archangium sp.]
MIRLVVSSALLLASAAHAFCGFYVSSAGADLFNDATMVVLMRDGTRTVLSMQNNYRGPTEDFALVIPVPVILKKENVKTLPKEVFARIDTLASPRLVEDYEPGECPPPPPTSSAMVPSMMVQKSGVPRDLGVKVEAKFDVAEYEIVILSAKDALGLDIWLKENKYKVPANAAPLLKPYVETNWKFFVARVNAKKVTFVDGQAVLSPLRFFYDSEKFELPVRLGLVNSGGTQDLIVHVIAKSRYELANRKNVMMPTNVQLTEAVMPVFGGFYAELLERTFKANEGAGVTEFAWKGALPPPRVMVGGIYGVTCDPCPPPAPVDDPLAKYLGADAIPGLKTDEDVAKFAREATITRLHVRYTKDSLTDDLVFKAAGPIAGGVPEFPKTITGAKENRFQGRYIVKHPFNVNQCHRYWGGGGMAGGRGFVPVQTALSGTSGKQAASTKLNAPFLSYLKSDVPELGLLAPRK